MHKREFISSGIPNFHINFLVVNAISELCYCLTLNCIAIALTFSGSNQLTYTIKYLF